MNISALTTKYITTPLRKLRTRNSIDTIGAMKTYNESITMLVDDFTGKQHVPNYNLKAVYDSLMVAYSQILAARRIQPKLIKSLKKLGVGGMEWAHVARLSDDDQVAFAKNLVVCPRWKMIQQAAFKNNSAKIMMSTLNNDEYVHMLGTVGINTEKFKKMLCSGQGNLFNLDMIKRPLADQALESEKTIGLRMIRRIVQNEIATKKSNPKALLPCFEPTILNDKYTFPDFFPQKAAYRNAHGYIVAETDKYLDAFDRFKVLDIVNAKINGRHVGVKLKEK